MESMNRTKGWFEWKLFLGVTETYLDWFYTASAILHCQRHLTISCTQLLESFLMMIVEWLLWPSIFTPFSVFGWIRLKVSRKHADEWVRRWGRTNMMRKKSKLNQTRTALSVQMIERASKSGLQSPLTPTPPPPPSYLLFQFPPTAVKRLDVFNFGELFLRYYWKNWDRRTECCTHTNFVLITLQMQMII